MSIKKQYLIIFLFGGIIYSMIEVLTRGYTHWTMTITAGIALMIIYHRHITHDDGILMKCLFGCVTITSCELIAGIIINLILHWDVWDYSNMYLNFLGQICPSFSAAWFLISFPAAYICEFVRVRALTENSAAESQA